jgi:hypothetical protein
VQQLRVVDLQLRRQRLGDLVELAALPQLLDELGLLKMSLSAMCPPRAGGRPAAARAADAPGSGPVPPLSYRVPSHLDHLAQELDRAERPT